MKARFLPFTTLALAVLLPVLGWICVGCKSTPKVDWNSRVGNYTYDQAVAELGPPDKSAKLSDGSTVAEWVSRRDRGGVSFGIGTGFYGSHSAVGVGQSVGTGSGERVLRLTFGPDNKLAAASKNY